MAFQIGHACRCLQLALLDTQTRLMKTHTLNLIPDIHCLKASCHRWLDVIGIGERMRRNVQIDNRRPISWPKAVKATSCAGVSTSIICVDPASLQGGLVPGV